MRPWANAGIIWRMRCLISVGLVILTAACGGGGSTTTPTAPAPIPASVACAALGATSGLAILSGEQCGVATTPVVKINLKGVGGGSVGTCTGTMIAPRAVLTAAHCLDGDVATAQVWFGVTGTPEIVASSIRFYPGYVFNTPNAFDVGVVLFAEDLGRTPLSILTSRQATVGETAIIAGWGRDENSETTQLRAGSTRISGVNVNYIETLYSPPSASVCSGDSGGPILVSQGGRWVIAGITSATTGVACNQGTNFYQAIFNTNVRDFIRLHVPTVGER
jgi:secreted trypsin-like serine protease